MTEDLMKFKRGGPMKNDKEAPKDQENLFGEEDHLFNVIETTRSEIVDEIKRCRESIAKKEDRIKDLDKRLTDVDKARATAKKHRDKEAEEKKK